MSRAGRGPRGHGRVLPLPRVHAGVGLGRPQVGGSSPAEPTREQPRCLVQPPHAPGGLLRRSDAVHDVHHPHRWALDTRVLGGHLAQRVSEHDEGDLPGQRARRRQHAVKAENARGRPATGRPPSRRRRRRPRPPPGTPAPRGRSVEHPQIRHSGPTGPAPNLERRDLVITPMPEQLNPTPHARWRRRTRRQPAPPGGGGRRGQRDRRCRAACSAAASDARPRAPPPARRHRPPVSSDVAAVSERRRRTPDVVNVTIGQQLKRPPAASSVLCALNRWPTPRGLSESPSSSTTCRSASCRSSCARRNTPSRAQLRTARTDTRRRPDVRLRQPVARKRPHDLVGLHRPIQSHRHRNSFLCRFLSYFRRKAG